MCSLEGMCPSLLNTDTILKNKIWNIPIFILHTVLVYHKLLLNFGVKLCQFTPFDKDPEEPTSQHTTKYIFSTIPVPTPSDVYVNQVVNENPIAG